MNNKIKNQQLLYLIGLISDNAAYLGLSDSTVRNMLKSALGLNGVEIKRNFKESYPEDKACKHFDRMPHHPLPNVSSFVNSPSGFGIIGALFGKLLREEKGNIKLSN